MSRQRRTVNVGAQRAILKLKGRLERYTNGWRGDRRELENDLMYAVYTLTSVVEIQEQRIRELEVATGRRNHT